MYNEHRKLIRLKDSLQEKEMEMVNNKFRVAANPTVSSSSVQFFNSVYSYCSFLSCNVGLYWIFIACPLYHGI